MAKPMAKKIAVAILAIALTIVPVFAQTWTDSEKQDMWTALAVTDWEEVDLHIDSRFR